MLIFEYGDSVISENVKSFLTEDDGMDLDEYIDFFGYPDEFEEMKIDPAWFNPPLPGMDEHVDYVATMTGAIDLLEDKKREAFIKDYPKVLYEEMVQLTEEEYETWLSKNYDSYLLSDIGQWIYDDMLETIDCLIKDKPYWRIEGTNFNWQGRSGHCIKKFDKPDDVVDIFRSYGDYNLQLFQTEEQEKGDGSFSASCSHHDCPTGSNFEFKTITEEEYYEQT